jgi:hypothetical protein
LDPVTSSANGVASLAQSIWKISIKMIEWNSTTFVYKYWTAIFVKNYSLTSISNIVFFSYGIQLRSELFVLCKLCDVKVIKNCWNRWSCNAIVCSCVVLGTKGTILILQLFQKNSLAIVHPLCHCVKIFRMWIIGCPSTVTVYNHLLLNVGPPF